MSDLKLDLVSGQLALENNDLVMVRGASETAQRLSIKFNWFVREWFEDPEQGVPWFERVLVKNPDLESVGALFRHIIEQDENIERIVDFNLALGADRVLRLSFAALDNNQEVVTFREFRLDGERNNLDGL